MADPHEILKRRYVPTEQDLEAEDRLDDDLVYARISGFIAGLALSCLIAWLLWLVS